MRITNYGNHGTRRKHVPGFEKLQRFAEYYIPKKYRRMFLDNQHYALAFLALLAMTFTACIFSFSFSSPAVVEDGFENLIAWVNENGGKIQDIELKNNDKGIRGLFAAQDIKKGDVIMHIPRKTILFTPHKNACDSDDNELLQEMKKLEKSFHWNYLKMMPSLEDYKSFHPLFLPRKMLNDFQPLTADFQYQDIDDCCREDTFKCHLAMIQRTRAYGSPKGSALVPIADLANTCHKNMNTKWEFDNKANFVMTATLDIPMGTEIFDTYSHQGNIQIYRIWGFMFEDNPIPTQSWPKHMGVCDYLESACKKYRDDSRAHPLMSLVREACPELNACDVS